MRQMKYSKFILLVMSMLICTADFSKRLSPSGVAIHIRISNSHVTQNKLTIN